MRKLRSVQCLRALAVSGVLLAHASDWPLGQAGVDIFFVISGLIIGMVLRGRTALEFFSARLWRIYPIYWFNALPIILAVALQRLVEPARLGTSITLWPVWGLYAPAYLVPAWTLSFEMLFYSMMAVAIACGRPLLVVPALLAAVAVNLLTLNPYAQFIGNPLVLEFCAGLLILNLPRNAHAGIASLLAGLTWFLLAAPPPLDIPHLMDPAAGVARIVSWGVPAALVVYGTLTLEKFFTRWSAVPVFLGDASYSIYLSHYIVNRVFPLWWPIGTAAMLGWGCVMFVLVERPLLKWRHQSRAVTDKPFFRRFGKGSARDAVTVSDVDPLGEQQIGQP